MRFPTTRTLRLVLASCVLTASSSAMAFVARHSAQDAATSAQVCVPDGFVQVYEKRHQNARLEVCIQSRFGACKTWGTPTELLVQETQDPGVRLSGMGYASGVVILFYCLSPGRP